MSFALVTCAFAGQVGHVKLGTVCTMKGAVKLRYTLTPKVIHVPKVGEDVYMDEQALIPKGCALAYKDRANQVQPVSSSPTWCALRRSQPEAVSTAQAKLNSTLDAAVKPRGAGAFLTPGKWPIPASLFRIRMLRPQTILSLKVFELSSKDASRGQLLFSGSSISADLPRALRASQPGAPPEGRFCFELVATTSRGVFSKDFNIMSPDDDAAVLATLQAADSNADPVARHIARATEFAKLSWFNDAADELDMAAALSLSPDQHLLDAAAVARRMAS
jgi:hypothetical protein